MSVVRFMHKSPELAFYIMIEKTEVIVLAAGKGTRMGGDLPKVLVPLHDRAMIDYVLDTVRTLDLGNPIVVVGHKAEMVEASCGVDCKYVLQETQQGTGHAVLVAESTVQEDTKGILIVYGDQPLVTADTLRSMVLPLNLGVKLVLATTLVLDDELFEEQFSRFGRIIRNEKGKIIKIVEAKDATPEELLVREVNVGFMAFDREWAFEHLHQLKNDNAQGEYYLTDLVAFAFQDDLEIDSVQLNELEALGANTPDQLEFLHQIVQKYE
jgi:bifunctional UDP-N-acetylglucosamine pyrophosphorylase/glucosamine-1-phosphate N-acetyltransferase